MLRTRHLSAALALTVFATALPVGAATDSRLRAVRGTVGYQPTSEAPFSQVFGSLVLTDDEFAVTRAASNGLLQLADSSEVALGAATTIQVGKITQAASAAAPTTMSLVAGAVRFTIRHPAGQQANYRFVTPTSQLAVRGTVGLLATSANGDVVTCIECAAGDVSITAGGNTFALLTGQTATISVAGAVTIAATTVAVVGGTSAATTFAQAGLNVTNSVAAFAPGIATTTAAATTTAVAAGAAAAAAGAGIAISNALSSPAPTTISVPIEASSKTRAPGGPFGPGQGR